MIVTSTWPMVSFLVGLTLFRERASVRKVMGMILLVGSVLLILLK